MDTEKWGCDHSHGERPVNGGALSNDGQIMGEQHLNTVVF